MGIQHGHPLGPVKAKGFAAARAHFIAVFADLAAPDANERFEREAANQMTCRGFENFRQRQGLSKADVDAWSNCVEAQVLICKAVETASAGLRSLNTQTQSDTAVKAGSKPVVSASMQGIGANALQVASSLAKCSLPECSAEWEQSMQRTNLDGVETALAPKMALRTLANAQQHKEVVPPLDEMVWQAKLEANDRSLKSAASRLRAWHSYTVSILGYCEKQSLPPRSSKDSQSFIRISANAGSAANDIGYVRYGCRLLKLCTSWRAAEVSSVLKGLGKKRLKETAHLLRTRFLLDDDFIRALAILCRWDLLLRVNSEGLPIFLGCADWSLQLPEGCSNGAWRHGVCLVLRPQAGKIRPKGSILARKCFSARMGGPRVCAYHTSGTFTASSVRGQSLWSFPGQQTLVLLRSSLLSLGTNAAKNMTWKAASWTRNLNGSCRRPSGKNHRFLGTGARRQFLSYIDASHVDASRVLRDSIEDDGDEVEDVAQTESLEDWGDVRHFSVYRLPVVCLGRMCDY